MSKHLAARFRSVAFSGRRFSSSSPFPLFQVDAFSSEPLKGNPAAVAFLPQGRVVSDEWMRRVAAENNLSETAFVTPEGGQDFRSSCRFNLRWFTPIREVSLCGHATLATAAALFAMGNKNMQLQFSTLSGTLAASRKVSDPSWIKLDFPLNPAQPVHADDDACELLHLIAGVVLKGSHIDVGSTSIFISRATKKLVVKVRGHDASILQSLKPSFAEMLETHDGSIITGVSVTVAGGPAARFDFSSRYFAPWNGINEDPVNGSSHTILAPLWASLLGKPALCAWQASQRGGQLQLELGEERISLSGQAVIVMEGKMTC